MGSAIIRQGINFLREKKREGVDIRIPRKIAPDDEFFAQNNLPKQNDAEIIENNGDFSTKQVEITEENSGFSYFLDGIERKKILSYYRLIPVIYGYVAGVVLKRTDKKMHSINLEKSQENFYVPVKNAPDSPEHYFSEQESVNLAKNTVNIGKIITKPCEGYPILPEQLIQAAHSEIQTARNRIEESLVKNWIDGDFNDGWLFVDGRLENKNKGLIAGANIAGIIKSHHASYFSYEDQYKVSSMKKGQRSVVFRPKDDKGKKENVYSWYLKIHYAKKLGNNNFGLIRIEVPAENRFLSKVDEISSWILLETRPVAFPASRWDRMVYPIKYCEDYLNSKAPSRSMIDSLY